jgi:hypothetical protein
LIVIKACPSFLCVKDACASKYSKKNVQLHVYHLFNHLHFEDRSFVIHTIERELQYNVCTSFLYRKRYVLDHCCFTPLSLHSGLLSLSVPSRCTLCCGSESGSGSTGSTCFWASWIWIRIH